MVVVKIRLHGGLMVLLLDGYVDKIWFVSLRGVHVSDLLRTYFPLTVQGDLVFENFYFGVTVELILLLEL